MVPYLNVINSESKSAPSTRITDHIDEILEGDGRRGFLMIPAESLNWAVGFDRFCFFEDV